MMNAYGFDEKIYFPSDPYDKYIYLDQYQSCWEYQEDTDEWVKLNSPKEEKQ